MTVHILLVASSSPSMAFCIKFAAKFLLMIVSVGLVSPATGHFFYCETSPVVQRLFMSKCLWEEGLTLASFTSSNLDVLCGMKQQFIRAFRCQLQFLARCHPETALRAPSAEINGIPAFLEGICSTQGFNRSCYDVNKESLNSCISLKLKKSSQLLGTQETFCPIMNKLSSFCVQEHMAQCGDVTSVALSLYLPSARPSQCFVTP